MVSTWLIVAGVIVLALIVLSLVKKLFKLAVIIAAVFLGFWLVSKLVGG